ncbi:MAG: isocitrate/isopropylmalate dehydrogenase family protein [Dehalococcoidales bacterium]|nr:isocitrate/isopropylmalate dehydrogenase family protein [Dehalococcoidales bacterium]
MKHAVTLIPGDGVGPEVIEAARRVLEATGVEFQWEVIPAGETALAKEGSLLPERLLESIRKNKVALKGPTTTPVGTGFRSVNVALRKKLDLYACLRPCRSYPGIPARYEDVNIVVVRENTEDLYAGIEFARGSPETEKLLSFLRQNTEEKVPEGSGISIKLISGRGTERIARFAFEYARANGRRKVTAVHKANIMKFTDGLFLDVSREVARSYPDIEFEDRIIDELCAQLVQRPQQFDVLVLPNLYGDIVSDLCAGLIGGLGVAPGANIGAELAVFEPTHGSAPKYTGLNKVNPLAAILSGVMMLRYLGEKQAADRLEATVVAIVAEGKSVTYDLKPNRDDPTAAGTSQMADAIISRLKEKIL